MLHLLCGTLGVVYMKTMVFYGCMLKLTLLHLKFPLDMFIYLLRIH